MADDAARRRRRTAEQIIATLRRKVTRFALMTPSRAPDGGRADGDAGHRHRRQRVRGRLPGADERSATARSRRATGSTRRWPAARRSSRSKKCFRRFTRANDISPSASEDDCIRSLALRLADEEQSWPAKPSYRRRRRRAASTTPPCGRKLAARGHRPEGRRAAAEHRPQRLPQAQGAAAAHPLRRPARPRQDDVRHRAAQRTGHVDPDDQRPGPVQAGRPAAVPHQRRGRLVPVHRRNPPHAARRRGVHLPGDGGFPHRHRARRGRQRPHHLDEAEALHAHRRHDAQRHVVQPDARPLQDARAPGVLHASRSWREIVRINARKLQTRDRRRRRPGDGPPQPRHAAHRQRAAAGGRATTPPARPTAASPSTWPAPRWTWPRWTARGWTSRTAVISKR